MKTSIVLIFVLLCVFFTAKCDDRKYKCVKTCEKLCEEDDLKDCFKECLRYCLKKPFKPNGDVVSEGFNNEDAGGNTVNMDSQ